MNGGTGLMVAEPMYAASPTFPKWMIEGEKRFIGVDVPDWGGEGVAMEVRVAVCGCGW